MAALDHLGTNNWFDLWHTHPDWKSKGNRFPENRVAVAQLTYHLLQYAENITIPRNLAIQIWASVCEDTGNNAVYLHTENPNGTPFPYQFEGVEWGVSGPLEIRTIINKSMHEIGRIRYADETVYIIRKKA